MKVKLIISALVFFSASAAAELITPEQHMEWEKKVFRECGEKYKLMNKKLQCEEAAYKERKKAGLARGTFEYVEKQYADFSNDQIKEQIEIAEKAAAEAPYLDPDIGELTIDDYQFEITAAKTLLQKRAIDKHKLK